MGKKSIKLRRREATSKELPFRCMCCGEPAITAKRKSFSWTPPWALAFLAMGLVPYVILALIFTKRMQVRVSLCQDHQTYFGKRSLLIWGSCGGVVLAIIFLLVVAAFAKPSDDSAVFGWICFGGGMVFVAWLVFAALLQLGTIRPAEITDNTITLTNLHPKFVRAVKLARGYDDDYDDEDYDDDYDPPPRRRRRRVDEDDVDDYADDDPPPRRRRRIDPDDDED